MLDEVNGETRGKLYWNSAGVKVGVSACRKRIEDDKRRRDR